MGSIIHFKPDQTIRIGRDGEQADIVINLPEVSRHHCDLTYHLESNEYELTDYSTNGTFVDETKRLLSKETYILKPGTVLCFGDKNTVYHLG